MIGRKADNVSPETQVIPYVVGPGTETFQSGALTTIETEGICAFYA